MAFTSSSNSGAPNAEKLSFSTRVTPPKFFSNSSRSALDKSIALSRMQQAGAELVTVESLLFEMIEGNKDPEFKDISRIIK